MPDESTAAVLHVTAAAGGGADRYIRDLAMYTTRRHYVLHVGAMIDVLEDIDTGRFIPLRNGAVADRAAIARWFQSTGIGIAHLHGVDDGCRARLAMIDRACALPYVITLHDLQFVNPWAFDLSGMPEAEPAWLARVAPTLEQAASVIAPSAFIRDVALQCVPGLDVTIVAPGIRTDQSADAASIPPDFAAQAQRHIVAVVGAIGPHKGSAQLDALASALEGSDIGIVVIGYTDTHLTRGWAIPGRLYVHGPYVDDTLPGWLAAYRTEAVLFPNRLPESFSYTLSEVWAQGIPVVVPDEGALGERVGYDGGGWCLPAGFSGTAAAALLIDLFSPEGTAERARVKSQILPGDTVRIPTLEAMSSDVDAIYARFSLPPAEAADVAAAGDALAPLLAANLDGFIFRKELVNLTGELAHAAAQFAESLQWSAKLETDIAVLKREQERLAREVGRLADIEAAFNLLPEIARKFLIKRAFRGRS